VKKKSKPARRGEDIESVGCSGGKWGLVCKTWGWLWVAAREKGKVRGSCSRGGLSGWFCVDERERGQCMGLRLKGEETKSKGGRRRLVCIYEWEWGGWFRRKKIKAGRGRLFGLDRSRVRFSLFFVFFLCFKIAPSLCVLKTSIYRQKCC